MAIRARTRIRIRIRIRRENNRILAMASLILRNHPSPIKTYHRTIVRPYPYAEVEDPPLAMARLLGHGVLHAFTTGVRCNT